MTKHHLCVKIGDVNNRRVLVIMKKFFGIALVLALVSMLFPFAVNQNSVEAKTQNDYYYIESLDTLEAIQDDEAALNSVGEIYVEANYSWEVQRVQNQLHLIKKCRNATALCVAAPGLVFDSEFINELPKSLSLIWLDGCVIDLENVFNPNITILRTDSCTAYNFSGITGLSNLRDFYTFSLKGFEFNDLDKLRQLSTLRVDGIVVGDYKTFFDKIKNVKRLELDYTDIKNEDTKFFKTLTKLEGLTLTGSFIDDISFLADLPNIKSLILPYGVKDLSVLYTLNNLSEVYFDAYTLLNVKPPMIEYFKSKNISYTQFDESIYLDFARIINSFNFNENTSDFEKLRVITDYVTKQMSYVKKPDYLSSLESSIKYGMGVCNEYALLEYTMLKYVGVDAYFVVGFGLVDGFYLAHAWNEVCIDNTWYAVDSTWIDDNTEYYRQAYYLAKTMTNITWEEYYIDTDYYAGDLFALTHITNCDPSLIVSKEAKPQNPDTSTPEDEPQQGEVINIPSNDGNQQSGVEITPADEHNSSNENSFHNNEIVDDGHMSPSFESDDNQVTSKNSNLIYWILGGAAFGLVLFIIVRVSRKK